ncbi:sugar phosphate isomerase/epimerase [Microbacterium oryzae]|uniref:Sugar phosphate isomerase/epimerase n=1 Tax=Microbacterium oryzae TaxID=743009 RepID=A0A6I6DV52_9MICO|nr:sugar phosphate isomerase/epimerase family protein [Microbacterium oryzae]QGU27996.1 sugar phosphate isomerase/epimerase [Microbacterium oryzae]
MSADRLVATCWTSAGDAQPQGRELSPFPILDRVRATAAAGWSGIGFGQDDLRHARDTIGFAALRAEIDDAGLSHVEVELATDWWREDDAWRGTWDLLLDAAHDLSAVFIKAGPGMGEPPADVTVFAAPLRRLAEEAADAGTRVALEPFPFGTIATIPQGVQAVRAADHPALGLLVDFWHVFRPGTSFAELREVLDPAILFGVELSDAEFEVSGTLFEDTRDNRRLIGEGAQDVVGFIRTIREIGYRGPWGVEILSAEHRRRPLDEAMRVAYATAAETLARA